MDDTLLFDKTIEQQFIHTCEFLDQCYRHGIIINLAKFQFAELEVDFVGFKSQPQVSGLLTATSRPSCPTHRSKISRMFAAGLVW